ncbi:recombinase family protein [Streptomyces platensis]|uniref:recombinase family protein n=1 Tax=Streptomyces platensis TaxID=58346 RepID=UPI003680DABA
MVTLGADLRERGIGLHIIEQGIDTATMEGHAMFGMLSVLAELQRELIVANTNDGLTSARARGRVGGRRPSRPSPRHPGLHAWSVGTAPPVIGGWGAWSPSRRAASLRG